MVDADSRYPTSPLSIGHDFLDYWPSRGSRCHACAEVGRMEMPALPRKVRSANGGFRAFYAYPRVLETCVRLTLCEVQPAMWKPDDWSELLISRLVVMCEPRAENLVTRELGAN